MSVVRRSCRKINTVRMTSTVAMSRVSTISLIDATTTADASKETWYSMPSGKATASSSMVSLTASEIERTLAPGSW
jgi:hypothetical protein